MKTKKITILLSLVCLFILAGYTKSYSQCSYVITGTSNDTTISISCNFPVFIKTGNHTNDSIAYQKEVASWDSAHQNMTVSKFFPGPIAGSAYIIIPESNFNNYSSARQYAIKNETYFYQIKK